MDVEGAGAINHDASSLQGGPDGVEYLALQCYACAHFLWRPVAYGTFVLAEHAFARTGHVGQNEVKLVGEPSEVGRCVARHAHVRRSPFGDVLAQYSCPSPIDLVAHQLASFGQYAQHCRAFASRRCAKVKGSYRLFDQRSQHVGHELRRCFLHVVASRMQQRVEGEVRPLVQIHAILGIPSDGKAGLFGTFSTIIPQAGRRLAVGQCMHEWVEFRCWQIRLDVFYKGLGEGHIQSILDNKPKNLRKIRDFFL